LAVSGLYFSQTLTQLILSFTVIQLFMTVAGMYRCLCGLEALLSTLLSPLVPSRPVHAGADLTVVVAVSCGAAAAAPFNGLVADLVVSSQRGVVRSVTRRR
jgi:hypothetical protein